MSNSQREIKRISEVTIKVGSGLTPKGGSKVYKKSGIKLIRSQNVHPGFLDLREIACISEEIHRSMISTRVEAGDVLLNITGASIGRCAIAPYNLGEANVNQHVCIIRPEKGELIGAYLMHFLNSYDGQEQINRFQAGGNREGLNFAQIKSMEIPLPPLPEQKKIAEILSGIDACISAQTRKSKVLDALITGTRNQLFQDILVDTCREEILAKAVTAPITYGIVQPGEHDPEGITLIRGQDYLQGWGKKEFFKVSPQLSSKYQRSLIQPRDVLVCIAGANTGDAAKVPDWIPSANITQTTARIRTNPSEVMPEFVLEFLRSKQGRERLMNYVRGSAQPGLNLADIEKVIIPIPESIVQKRIVESLNSLCKIRDLAVSKARFFSEMKRGISSDLLSGRKRVSV